jgi:quercetin dioxygenase-like cupin family protein
MTIRLEFDRIPPRVEIGPHRHGVETIVYVAAGELVFEHGDALERRSVVRPGDVLYEAPAEHHLIRNEGTADVLALIASTDPDPRRTALLRRRWDRDEEPVARRQQAEPKTIDGVTRRLIAAPGDFGTETFAVAEVELPPGWVDEWHRHPTAEHALVVLEGRGVVQVGQVEETLEPLVGIRIDPNLPHRIENTGRTRLRLLVYTTPGADPMLDRQSAEAPRRRGHA